MQLPLDLDRNLRPVSFLEALSIERWQVQRPLRFLRTKTIPPSVETNSASRRHSSTLATTTRGSASGNPDVQGCGETGGKMPARSSSTGNDDDFVGTFCG